MVALIMKHRWTWSGFTGAPGYSTFYGLGTGSQAFVDGIRVFLQAAMGSASGSLPTGCTIVPDTTVDIINDSNGFLDSTQVITPPTNIIGGAVATYGSPMGIAITWTTAGIATPPGGRPRRVRGRTFLVPCSAATFDNDGTPTSSKLTAINSAAATYVAGSWNPCIWHRPTSPGANDGQAFRIITGQASDRAAILTSRRAA